MDDCNNALPGASILDPAMEALVEAKFVEADQDAFRWVIHVLDQNGLIFRDYLDSNQWRLTKTGKRLFERLQQGIAEDEI